MSRAFFEKLIWQKDRMLLDDLVFRLEHYKDEHWELGEDCFSFYKIKPLVDQYTQLWSAKGQFRPQNILELGMWDGGSIVFWFECFHPKKHVGIDLSQRGDSRYFQNYITSRGLEGRIKTYWGTDQADSERLREIVRNEFGVASQDHGHERAGAVLDLVIDDASHMYEATKTSFETLFPLLRPGGLYIIEDWAWAHWEEFQAPHHPWATETALTQLIFELVEAAGSSNALIASLGIFQGFTVVERGKIGSAELGEFEIERYISSRPAEEARLIQEHKAQITRLTQERDVWQAEVARLTQELNTIYSSRTWRIAKKGLRVYQLAEAAGSRLVGAPGTTPGAEAPVGIIKRAANEVAFNYYMMFKLNKTNVTMPPNRLFGNVSDDFWWFLNTEGYRRSSVLREILPALPDEYVQIRFTGSAGDTTLREGFSAYTLFKQIVENHLGNFAADNNVLDFGCGWGRVIRFFLKDIEPSKLWGIDCFPEVIEICKQTNKWCSFKLIDPMPPTSFSKDMFDLIYCYTVFSHLSEDAHKKWLVEFSRILRPGGLLIATTRPREFIETCAEVRREKILSLGSYSAAVAFQNTEQALSDYDSGIFCYSPVGGGDVLDSSFYGEACIPKRYVLNHWTEYFTFLDFVEDRNLCLQNVIVVRK